MHTALRPFANQGVSLIGLMTLGAQPVLTGAIAHGWSDLLARSQRHKAWRLLAHVTLTEHAHLVVVPPKHMTLDQVVWGLLDDFQAAYCELLGMPSSMAQVWQRSYQVHHAGQPEDLARFLDYVHYNPVRHGVAARPEAWPHSSYSQWVDAGVYKLGWGWTEPTSIQGKNWE